MFVSTVFILFLLFVAGTSVVAPWVNGLGTLTLWEVKFTPLRTGDRLWGLY